MMCIPVACIILAFALVLASYSAPASASRGKIGVDYGLNGDNLLTPKQTVELLCSKGITRVRIYEARPDVIQAFANSGIDLTIGVPNEEVPKIAANLGEAFNWVTKYVLPFPTSSISAILVGNEWLTDPSNDPSVLVPAMQNIYNALSTLQLFDIYLSGIQVSTPHSFAVLSNPSFPPSAATFAEGFVAVMRPLLDFLEKTDSFFMVNIFPYFSYVADEGVSLEFALFQSTEAVTDPNTGLKYTNLFDLQLDAVYAAITSLLSSASPPSSSPCACNNSEVPNTSQEHVHLEARNRKSPSSHAKKPPTVHTGETGWPSGGGSPGTPPGGRHGLFFPSRHSTSTLSSTRMSSSSTNAHDRLNHHTSLQNNTLTRSATLPSTMLTSFSPSHFTSPLSSSSLSHDLSTHTMPSNSTHTYVTPSSSKVQSSATSSSSSPSFSTISTRLSSSSSSMIPSLTDTSNSSNINEHSSRSSPSSSSASISHIEEKCFSSRAQYATNAQEGESTHCTCNAATLENARTYNQNLIRHVLQAKGTPAHPNTPIWAYIFEVFNEDLKPDGPEQHFGLFFPNGTAVYPINFNDRGK